jgi:hypothetical protein
LLGPDGFQHLDEEWRDRKMNTHFAHGTTYTIVTVLLSFKTSPMRRPVNQEQKCFLDPKHTLHMFTSRGFIPV